jgi:hypothetical protein
VSECLRWPLYHWHNRRFTGVQNRARSFLISVHRYADSGKVIRTFEQDCDVIRVCYHRRNGPLYAYIQPGYLSFDRCQEGVYHQTEQCHAKGQPWRTLHLTSNVRVPLTLTDAVAVSYNERTRS